MVGFCCEESELCPSFGLSVRPGFGCKVVARVPLLSPRRVCFLGQHARRSVVRWSGSGGGATLRKCFSVSGVLCVNN